MSKAPERRTVPGKPPSSVRIALAFAGFLAIFGLLLFGSAGRVDWFAGWLYLAILTINAGANYAYLRRVNPALIEHRIRLGKGTETWDKIWLAVFSPVFVAVYVVAGLDAGRLEWSAMPAWLWLAGLALFVPGALLFSWSMGVNPFFEKTVRIQSERGHRVIDSGPYRLVRHPGYSGFLGWIVSAPLLLGSWWAFLPAVLSIVLLVVRTALEDRTLRDGLPGYGVYAARIRYRLLPKVW